MRHAVPRYLHCFGKLLRYAARSPVTAQVTELNRLPR
jgi:hypothetical protein